VRNLLIVVLLATFGLILKAQNAMIREKGIIFKSYPLSDPNSVPEFITIFPYFHFNGYSALSTDQKWKRVEMENDYIKVWVSPLVGGKIC
jgi:hypothetical protein